MIQHTILNEKYRPSTLEQYICTEENKVKFQEYIKNQDIPHLLFHGKAGSGKTTLAKILANNIDCDFLYINATDERSMDVMREKVGAFASAASFKPLKIVILDEATHLLQASQVLLLNMIETYSRKTRFILTGNYVERLIDPLRSRLIEYTLSPPLKKDIANHLDHILTQEEVKYEIQDLALIINKFYPDTRRIVNYCQKNITNGSLVLDKKVISGNSNYLSDILNELKSPKKESWVNIRQLLADADINSYEELYRYLYDNIDTYCKGLYEIIVILEKGQYQANFSLDKEINIMSTISEILQTIK